MSEGHSDETGGVNNEGLNGAAEPAAPVQPETVVALAARTLSGDLRDHFIDVFRGMKNPWYMLSEMEQTRIAEDIGDTCRGLVRRAVEMIAADDFPTITATLSDVKIKKDGIEGKIGLGRFDPERHVLFDAAGKEVMVILTDSARYIGARGLAKVDRQALFDAPPKPVADADEAGEAIGTLPAAESGAEPPVVHLDNSGNPAAVYTDGYDDGRNGRAFVDVPYATGTADLALYQAGWLQAQIDGLKDSPTAQQGAIAGAAQHFREVGRTAFLVGAIALDTPRATLADCPLANWMPAAKWWREGLVEAVRADGAEAAADGAGCAANPYDEGTDEAGAWLSGWNHADGDYRETGGEEPPARRRGRPRKQPPDGQPEA